MIRLVTRGRFTRDFVKAIVGAPEDREPAVRKLIEGAGGKVICYYVTTGENDFLLISEANESEANCRVNGCVGCRYDFSR